MKEPSRIQAFIAAGAFGVVLYAGVTAYTQSKFPDVPTPTVKLVPSACWTEDKPALPSERICGPVVLAPYGAYEFSDSPEIPKGLDF